MTLGTAIAAHINAVSNAEGPSILALSVTRILPQSDAFVFSMYEHGFICCI